MRRQAIVLVLLALLATGTALKAQSVDSQDLQNREPNASAIATPESDEVTLLKAQLAAVSEFHESILSTVYWALGGTFVLAGLLLGFGWLANFKVYERDKNAMKAELDSTISTKLTEIESLIATRMADVPEMIATQTATSVSESFESLKTSISKLSKKMFDIEVSELRDKMHNNPSTSMALTDALRLLGLCINKSPNQIPDILHFMLKTIDKGGKLTADEITRLNSLLDSLPPHYRTLTQKLSEKLTASDIF